MPYPGVGRRLDGTVVLPAKRSKSAKVGNMAARAAINAAVGTAVNSLASRFGFGPPSGPGSGPITVQSDFVASRGKRKYQSYTQKKRNRQSRLKAKRLRKKYKRMKRRFAKRVKKVLNHHFRYNVWASWGRSWKSVANSQLSAVVPIFSWRGDPAFPTPSVAINGVPSQNQCIGLADMAVKIKELVDSEVFYPNSTGSNLSQPNWWFKVNRAVLDLTLSNTGTSAETTPSSTNNKLEFELYYVTIKRRPLTTAGFYNTIDQLQDYWDAQTQALGANTIGAADRAFSNSVNYVPWLEPENKKWLKTKIIGRGYLPVGQSQRFHFSYKPKMLFNRKSWAAAGDTDNINQTFCPKATAGIMVIWRGAPSSGQATGGYPAVRLTFNCNHQIYFKTHQTGQVGQKGTKRLYADNFA